MENLKSTYEELLRAGLASGGTIQGDVLKNIRPYVDEFDEHLQEYYLQCVEAQRGWEDDITLSIEEFERKVAEVENSEKIAKAEAERAEAALNDAENARLEAEQAKQDAENLRVQAESKLAEQAEANAKLSRVEAQNDLAWWFLASIVALIALPMILLGLKVQIADSYLQTYKELLFLLIPILSIVFTQLYGAKKTRTGAGTAEVES